jgi:tetratricopeptide (TPR) repeat protein
MVEQSNYYKGMLKYHNKQFQEAIPFFEHVTSSDLSQHALFYKGCCYQYLLDTAKAMEYFQSLSDNPALNNNLADDVQKHKEAIQNRATNIGKYAEHQGNVDILLQNIEHNNILKMLLFNDHRFMQTVQNFMNKIREHVDDLGVTTHFKELKQLLAETKYARIKKLVKDEVVVAEEFKDVPVIYNQLTTQPTFDQQEHTDYIGALTILDDTLVLIGKVSQGMIVDD